MSRVLCLVLLMWGCAGERKDPPNFQVAKGVVLQLRPTDIVAEHDVDTEIQWTTLNRPTPEADDPLSSTYDSQVNFRADVSGRYDLALSFGAGLSLATYRFSVMVGDRASDIVPQQDFVGPVRVPIDLTVEGYRDLNSDSLVFEWTVVRAPETSVLLGEQYGGPSVARETFVADVIGEYELELLATDVAGESSRTSFLVTATPFYQTIRNSSEEPHISYAGGTLLYGAGRKALLFRDDGEPTDIELEFLSGGSISDVELFDQGALGVVLGISGLRLHVVDVAQARVTQVVSLGTQHREVIGYTGEEILVSGFSGGVTAVNLTTGAVSSALPTSVLDAAYDGEQDAFYSASASGITKWEPDQGAYVAGRVVVPAEPASRLLFSVARSQLVEQRNGSVYSVSLIENDDVLLLGGFGSGFLEELVQPLGQSWSAVLRVIPDTFGEREIAFFSADPPEPAGTPLAVRVGLEGRLQTEVEVLGIAESSHADEIYVVLDVVVRLDGGASRPPRRLLLQLPM